MAGDPFAAGAVVDGRYRSVRMLGVGGGGRVYLVEDRLLGERAALKLLSIDAPIDGDVYDRFLREAAIAHAIHHPNVARTYDVGEHEGVPYLTMEWLDGETLRERVRLAGPLPPREVRGLAVSICRGLRAAHRAGIVHRDLKPANVMLVPSARRAVLMDFGISEVLGAERDALAAARENRVETAPGDPEQGSVVRGTPAFMAPEQWDGGPVDARTDLYALGCILYFAASGRHPFEARTYLELAAAHATAPVPRLADHVSGGGSDVRTLDRLISACMAKRPEERPDSVDEILAILQRPDRLKGFALRLAITASTTVVAAVAIHVGVFAIARHAVLRELRPSLERLATLVSRDLDPDDLDRVHEPEDMEDEPFKRARAVLLRYREENPEVAFVYTLRRTGGTHDFEFVVDDLAYDVDRDGDGRISPEEDGSPPGTPFETSHLPALAQALALGRATSDEDFHIDYWGHLMSGYAPILRDGRPTDTLVGVDVSHRRLDRLRHGLARVLAGVSVLIVLGVAAASYPWRRPRRARTLSA